MTFTLKDAHNHLHFSQLGNTPSKLVSEMKAKGIVQCVVNGTIEEDWLVVLDLAEKFPDFVTPALGLHPWKVNQASDSWFDKLRQLTFSHKFAIGEVGLDKWVKNHDLNKQKKCFEKQLCLAAENNFPISIHCLQAWGSLIEILANNPLPERGVHIHGFGGSCEILEQLLDFRVYFSLGGYFLSERKASILDLYKMVPNDNLMLETDAPDMLPPEAFRENSESPWHHPSSLAKTGKEIARRLDRSFEELAITTSRNFDNYFSLS